MNLGCLLAAPSVVRSGRDVYLVRPLRLKDFAFLLRACADDLGRDADGGDEPLFGDEATSDWLSGRGLPLLLWCALARDRPGLTIAEAETLTETLDAATVSAIYVAAMRRDSTGIPEAGQGKDIVNLGWSKVAYRYYDEKGILPDAIGEMTLDQMHMLQSRGDDGTTRIEREQWADLQRQYEEAKAKQDEEARLKIHDPVEVTLADLGFEIVPEQEETKSEGEDHA